MTTVGTGPGADRAPATRLAPVVRAVGLRLAGAVFVLFAVVTIVFFAFRFAPGDPALAIVGGGGAAIDEQTLSAARAEFGLDQPLLTQYLRQLGDVATGDLGTSYALRTDVTQLVGERIGPTLLLAGLALALAWVLALTVAVFASRGGRIGSALASTLEVVSAATPHFWLASLLIVVFASTLRLLPATSGRGPEGLVLPVIVLAIPLAGFLGQVMREALLDALDSPFALSARARGESETGVRRIHALRHAVIPAISLSGWAFGSLMSGAVVVESVFARQGMGRTLLQAVVVRDIPVVLGVLVTVAAVYIVVNLLADAGYRLADPRLRKDPA